MWQWWRGTGIAIVAIALQTWACSTQIAPQIETERRFTGTVQAPPPAPPVPFDMSLFLRKLSAGQFGVTGGFTAGPVRGTVSGTLTGNLDTGTFDGKLSAPETRPSVAAGLAPRTGGVLALVVLPSLALMQGGACVVEQQYIGTFTATGIVWTPREIVHSCPTNPLGFSIQAGPVVQPPTTSVASTSSVPTTSVATTSTTTSIQTSTTTTIPQTSTTTTSVGTTSTTISTTSSSTTTIPRAVR
jgi:hypothetical protein